MNGADTTISEAPRAFRRGQAEEKDSLRARNARLTEGELLKVRVRRSADAQPSSFRDGAPAPDPGSRDSGFDANASPRNDVRGTYQDFEVPYRKWMRVLDALNWIAENAASDLAFRWFCGSKMCGTCALRMNGREVLACWEAVEPDMVIEPLRNLPVVRDLVVDRASYERKVASFEPWLERAEPYRQFPEPLTHAEMKSASKALDCISCMCCYSACPVIGLGDLTDFAGPAPLVQFGQTALDPRNDSAKVARTLAQTGIFNCVSCYKCEEVCPAGIPIVSMVIEPLKARAAILVPPMANHPLALRSVVAARGRVDPGALILRVQGLRALARLPRIVRLWLRGKVRPLRTLIGAKTAAADAARRLLAGKS